jgi:hypothetical protein
MGDLWNLDESTTTSVFEEKKRNNDGLWRPDPEDGDKETGYLATIRFLPNFTKKEVVENAVLEKHTHYIKLEDHPELNGTYDCQKVFGETNPLYDAFWKLKNSRSVLDQEKAKNVSRTTKYYSYVLIVEDKQHPELEGKIMIFPYGFKISQKIKEEKQGTYGSACNIFDLADGKDFRVVVKKIGGFNNYDSSRFMEKGPITFVKDGVKKAMPVSDDNGRKVIDEKVREKVKEILLKREHDLEEFAPKKWSDEDKQKVHRVVQFVLGTNVEFSAATSRVNEVTGATSTPSTLNATPANATNAQVDDFFNDL